MYLFKRYHSPEPANLYTKIRNLQEIPQKLALTYDTVQRIIYSANFGATKR